MSAAFDPVKTLITEHIYSKMKVKTPESHAGAEDIADAIAFGVDEYFKAAKFNLASAAGTWGAMSAGPATASGVSLLPM